MAPTKKNLRTKNNSQLIEDVLNLNKRPQIKRPSRSEPTINISEFNLVKSITGKQGEVLVGELAKVLKNRGKHVKISKKIQSTRAKGKTLPKPLEQPKAQRLRRTIAFEGVKKQLNRWDAVVTSNRASDHLTFPLPTSLDVENVKLSENFRLKTELQKNIEAVTPKIEVINIEEEPKYPLTMQELMERRRETAKMRAIQSYKETKARRRNKIKSKQYHRIQRREKTKNQMKTFEELQKTKPAEALKMLDEIERTRAKERATLRHRSTGKWAKNKQIRAKYDKEERQALAQQLAISRDLTQKIKNTSDSESENENTADNQVNLEADDDNPWTKIKPINEVQEEGDSYKKFWDAQTHIKVVDNNQDFVKKMEQPKIISTQNHVKSSKDKTEILATSDWDVGILTEDDSESLDNVSNKIGESQKPIKEKRQKLKRVLSHNVIKPKKTKRTKAKKQIQVDLSFPSTARHPVIDAPLSEATTSNFTAKNNVNLLAHMLVLHSVLKGTPKANSDTGAKAKVATKAVNLDTEIPDLLTLDDNEENADQRVIITEAFQDDDIVGDFRKEKKDEINANRPHDINLALPGWGSWGGTGIKPSKRKNKHFIVSFPKKVKRRDENQGNLIINEKPNQKVKAHLVSEVPFPFKTVKDFEASIRAPVGRTFIPETAYRKMIRPAVYTKMGVIIGPMTDEILLKKKK